MTLPYLEAVAATLDPRPLDRAVKALLARQPGYRLACDYYEGRHHLTFATEKFRNAFGSLLKAFADNLCGAVVDATVDRLEVTGLDVESGDKAAVNAAWEIWQINRMDLHAIEAHQEAALYGDAFVIVWPNEEGQPELYVNEAACTTVHYDTERRGVIDWAAKWWRLESDQVRLNLYYTNRIEKYITAGGYKDAMPERGDAFQPIQIEGEYWPLPNPFGRVPVFHLANNAFTGRFGRSELADVIPLQDALNKTLMDLLVGMEYVALPQRYVTGLQVEIDPDTGKARMPFQAGPGNLWANTDKDVQFGQFPEADLSHIQGAVEDFRLEIARVSRTPLHYLMPHSGDFPSGEALKTAEGPFLAKIRRRQIQWGNVWEDVLRFALKMSNGPEARFSALWSDAAPRSEKDHIDTLAVKVEKLGVTDAQAQREAGYTDKQIKTMADERAAQRAAFPSVIPAAVVGGAQTAAQVAVP